MPSKKKRAHEMNDHELIVRLFGKRGHKALHDLVLALEEKPKRKPPTRKPKP